MEPRSSGWIVYTMILLAVVLFCHSPGVTSTPNSLTTAQLTTASTVLPSAPVALAPDQPCPATATLLRREAVVKDKYEVIPTVLVRMPDTNSGMCQSVPVMRARSVVMPRGASAGGEPA